MPIIEIENVSDKTVILADREGHYATMKPKSITVLDDSLLAKECIASPLRNGDLRIVKPGARPKAGKGPQPSALQKKVEEVVSRHSGTEVEDETAVDVVSHHKTEGSDYVPQPAAAVDVPENKMTSLGSKLVKRGRKKKLVEVTKPEKMVRHTPNDPKKRLPNVVEVQGERPLPVRGGDDGARLVIASNIPGGATVMPLDDALWDQLGVLAEQTNQLIDGAVKDKKMHLYATMDFDKRKVFITNTKDVEFLKEISKFEWNADLMKLIRGKMSELGAE